PRATRACPTRCSGARTRRCCSATRRTGSRTSCATSEPRRAVIPRREGFRPRGRWTRMCGTVSPGRGGSVGWDDDVIAKFRESKGTENHWGPKLIVMHTIGARSGETRLAPVVGFRNDAGWLVVASKGGAPENPAWYHNLLANPSFDVEALEDGEIAT